LKPRTAAIWGSAMGEVDWGMTFPFRHICLFQQIKLPMSTIFSVAATNADSDRARSRCASNV
jgi:hypothetical protein